MKEKAKPTTTAQPFRAIRRAGVPICCFETAKPGRKFDLDEEPAAAAA